jgi:phosphatidylserine/phosphatidylglycerophosphate/cardiolipin synthase-like enzyme
MTKDQKFADKYIQKLIKGNFSLKGKQWKLRMVKAEGTRVVFSRPKFGELYLEKIYIDLINKSKYEVLIENSYLIPSPELLDAFVRASQRGVKIKIITNGPETNEPPIVMTPLARFYYKDLLDINQGNPRHEVELYEWTGRYKGTKDIHFGMVHSKFGVFDRKITLIGSYNFDNISRGFNEEVAVVFEGEELALFIAERFYNFDLDYTERIKYKDALKYKQPRSFGKKILLKILRKYQHRL